MQNSRLANAGIAKHDRSRWFGQERETYCNKPTRKRGGCLRPWNQLAIPPWVAMAEKARWGGWNIILYVRPTLLMHPDMSENPA